MSKYDGLSKKKLKELLLKMSPDTLKEFREADKSDVWLLHLNLKEIKDVEEKKMVSMTEKAVESLKEAECKSFGSIKQKPLHNLGKGPQKK